jgi:putative hemolysin
MAESLPVILWLVAIYLVDLLLVIGRSALVNSSQEVLAEEEKAGVPGAGLALRVVTSATRLMWSMRVGQGVLRVAILCLAAIAWVHLSESRVIDLMPGMALAIVAAGLAVALGELVGDNLALRGPERVAVRLAPFVGAVVWMLAPVGALARILASWLAGPQDGRRHPLVTEEAIMTLVDAGEEGGVIEEEEKAMIYSIFQLSDTLAREVMVPRIDILAFGADTSPESAADSLLDAGYSRAPVFAGSIDHVIGLVYLKDLLATIRKGSEVSTIREVLRDAYFVPEAKKVDDLLAEMQTRRVHMAVVVDEYGGTAGVVTIEDIVEEIVGEILDEYDVAEEAPLERMEDGATVFAGRISLDDVEEAMDVDLPKGSGDTLGGLVFNQLGRVPAPGEAVEVGGLRLVVEQVTGRRIRKVRATRVGPARPGRGDRVNLN